MTLARAACLWVLAAVALLAAAAPAAARLHDPEALPEVRIQDLPYGDMLFYYYQGKDFEAATRLLAYQHWQQMPHHEADARLLLGGLYLSLGMYDRANQAFQELLTRDVPTGVRNRAWLYLAQALYARGQYAEAERDLVRISERMSPHLESQKELLLANVWMREGRFDQASQLLERWRGAQQGWTAYARLNLGIALVRQGRLAEAAPILHSVGTMYALAPEMLAVKDRANLTLGVAYLQAKQSALAREALDRVRLDGPFSDEALLADGWADAADGNYRAALTPWLALHGRSPLDAAVQEADLTVPYAFVQLRAPGQAVQYYKTALSSYDAASAQIDGAIARIRGGSLLAQLLARDADGPTASSAGNDPLDDDALPDRLDYGWFWQLARVPDDPESHYLYTVFAEPDFQEALRNYRDLKLMQRMLGQWSTSMDAFQQMIAARQQAFAERLPKVDALLTSGALGALQQRHAALASRLAQVAGARDVAALATGQERAQWERVLGAQAKLARDPDTPAYAKLRERLRLVRGVLLYQMDQEFAARLRHEQVQLHAVDVALAQAQARWAGLESSRQGARAATGDFAQRVSALQQRIGDLQVRLAAAETAQSGALAALAVRSLEQRKKRLLSYRVQAQFALATIYDQAAHAGDSGAAAPDGASPAAVPGTPRS
ncbi:MAG TPA: tetratricopeptide repeat protein [Steroidobacteraceae bacterium]|nr:tetratricopeptide repeat protein [Steroidobacteraceae bacterium]